MKRVVLCGLAAASLCAFATEASAMCHWTFVNGKQQQLCDNAYDVPAIPTPGIAPIMPPSIKPIQTPVIPPVGTRSCEQAQVWNGTAYQWQTVCH